MLYFGTGSNKYLIQDLKESSAVLSPFWREEAGARNAKLHCLGGCSFDAECKTLSVEQILGKNEIEQEMPTAHESTALWKKYLQKMLIEQFWQNRRFFLFLDQNIYRGWYLT